MLAAVLLAGAAAPPGAAAIAAPGWFEPTPPTFPTGPGRECDPFDLVTTRSGEAVVACTGRAAPGAEGEPLTIEAAVWRPGAGWSALEPLSNPERETYWYGSLATAPDGTVLAAWVEGGSHSRYLVTAVRPPGGNWGPRAIVYATRSHDLDQLEATLGANGTQVLTWLERGRGLRAITFDPGIGWSQVQSIPPEGTVIPRRVAGIIHPDGAATLVMTFGSGCDPLAASRRQPGGSWSTIVTTIAADADLDLAPERLPLVIWNTDGVLGAQLAADGAAWTPIARLPDSDPDPYTSGRPCSRVPTAFRNGQANVVWRRATDKTLLLSELRADGTWTSQPGPPSDATDSVTGFAAAAGGRLLLLARRWTDTGGAEKHGVRATYLPADGTAWSPPLDFYESSTTTRTLTGLSQAGNAVLLWTDPFTRALHTAALDLTPPTIDRTRIPKTGTVGGPLTLDAVSEDWSPLTASWDFGDGTGAQESFISPTHTYLRSGTFTITVAARNAAGLTTGPVTQTIRITSQQETPAVSPLTLTQPARLLANGTVSLAARCRGATACKTRIRVLLRDRNTRRERTVATAQATIPAGQSKVIIVRVPVSVFERVSADASLTLAVRVTARSGPETTTRTTPVSVSRPVRRQPADRPA